MKSRLLIIGIMIAVSFLFTIAYFTNEGLDVERCTNDTVYKDFTGEIVLRETCIFPFTEKTVIDTFLGCDETFTYNGTHCIPKNIPNQFTETKIPLDTSDESLKSKTYIANCDETLYKEELPNLTIENFTHNYDMQYCKWELKYPDLTLITNENLLNNSPYCAELFDTLFDYYQSIRDDCGMQRYNKDGTPRAICEPLTAGARVPYDVNMIKSGCIDHYADWAHQTKHNDDVFYLFGRDVINDKIHGNLDEQIKIIDKLCEDNDYHDVDPNIKFRNNTHWIDTNHCALNIKDVG